MNVMELLALAMDARRPRGEMHKKPVLSEQSDHWRVSTPVDERDESRGLVVLKLKKAVTPKENAGEFSIDVEHYIERPEHEPILVTDGEQLHRDHPHTVCEAFGRCHDAVDNMLHLIKLNDSSVLKA